MHANDSNRATRGMPYQPNLAHFPEIDLTKDTLPAHNALLSAFSPVAPRPTAPIVNTPSMSVPQGAGLPLEEIVLGGGYGQGVVPNSPRPAPPVISTPRISLPVGVTKADYDVDSYFNSGFWKDQSQLVPESSYIRPSHLLEIYGSGANYDVSHLDIVRPEQRMPSMINHGVDEVFGNNAEWETDRAKIRPTNPRAFSAPPSVNMKALRAESKRIPINNMPLIPAPTGPRRNINGLVSKSLGKPKPVAMQAEYVAPPVRAQDLGGLVNSKYRGFGTGVGRAFGASANLMH
ncbi:MAG: hypothetical protein CL398_00260 [Acidiferrobacteraceae bacterium]|nr:hypothetical protein [Acidiferrobacteraceae bacterium]